MKLVTQNAELAADSSITWKGSYGQFFYNSFLNRIVYLTSTFIIYFDPDNIQKYKKSEGLFFPSPPIKVVSYN